MSRRLLRPWALLLNLSQCCAALRSPVRCSTPGWSYESVDPTTGRTALESLYDARLQRIRRVFETPIPPLPRDGSVEPDFLVGFAHYEYRLRDQYRAVLAAELDVPVSALRLSVAWSGRFDVTHFNRVRKVCGVVVRPAENTDKAHIDPDASLSDRIAKVVAAINSRRTAALLGIHAVQATGAIPEVHFAEAQNETAVAARLRRWVQERVLRPHLVVVLVSPGAAADERWVRVLHQRRVVPRVIAMDELTRSAIDALRRGDIGGLHAKREEEGEESTGGKNTTKTAASDSDDEEKSLEAPRIDDDAAWDRLLRRALLERHDRRVGLPLLFVHGECAGGTEEMRYLAANREALDALLLHPNDVAFKKNFMKRFYASHSRLRMAEEMKP